MFLIHPTTLPNSLPRTHCSLFSVAVGLFIASLTSFLLILWSLLEERPALHNVTVVSCFLHLMVKSSLCSMVYLKPLKILCPFPYWYLSPIVSSCRPDGFCCKMQLSRNVAKTAFGGLIWVTSKDGSCVLTDNWHELESVNFKNYYYYYYCLSLFSLQNGLVTESCGLLLSHVTGCNCML